MYSMQFLCLDEWAPGAFGSSGGEGNKTHVGHLLDLTDRQEPQPTGVITRIKNPDKHHDEHGNELGSIVMNIQ